MNTKITITSNREPSKFIFASLQVGDYFVWPGNMELYTKISIDSAAHIGEGHFTSIGIFKYNDEVISVTEVKIHYTI